MAEDASHRRPPPRRFRVNGLGFRETQDRLLGGVSASTQDRLHTGPTPPPPPPPPPPLLLVWGEHCVEQGLAVVTEQGTNGGHLNTSCSRMRAAQTESTPSSRHRPPNPSSSSSTQDRGSASPLPCARSRLRQTVRERAHTRGEGENACAQPTERGRDSRLNAGGVLGGEGGEGQEGRARTLEREGSWM